MTEPLRRQLHQAAQGPSGPVDLAHIEARSRRLRRRARRTTGSILATVLAVAVIGVVAVSSGDSSPVRLTTAPPDAEPIAQMTVRAEVESHVAALLAPTRADLSHSPVGLQTNGTFSSDCREALYGAFLQASGTLPADQARPPATASTPVYVCEASHSTRVLPNAPTSSMSVLYVATVASYAELLSGRGGVPTALVDQPSSAATAPSVSAWFSRLADQPNLAVAGVTNHLAPPPPPHRSSRDPRYVDPAYVERAALARLQCPAPPHLTGVRDTSLPPTSSPLVAFGASTCTSVTIQFAAHPAAGPTLPEPFRSSNTVPSPPKYIVTVDGKVNPSAGRVSGPGPFFADQVMIEVDATTGRFAGVSAGTGFPAPLVR